MCTIFSEYNRAFGAEEFQADGNNCFLETSAADRDNYF